MANETLNQYKKIYGTFPTLFGEKLHIDDGNKFYLIRGEVTNPSFPKGYVFAKIDKVNGDIYSQSGKKPQGSEYNGIEFIDPSYGVIVLDSKRKLRLEKLKRKQYKSNSFSDSKVGKFNIQKSQ